MKRSFFRDPWSWVMLLCVCMVLIAGSFAVVKWRMPADQPVEEKPIGPDADAVFTELFAQPDWEYLCDLAQLQHTPFESCHQFDAYMTQKTAGKTLSYQEFRADEVDSRRYVVFCDGEKIAAWTLSAKIQWQLEKLEIFIKQENSVMISADLESTVYVNGVALDDKYTVQTMQTKAEHYLPDGAHGIRSKLQRVDGLIATPVVTVKDKDGNELALDFDEKSGIYRQQIAAHEISEVQAIFVKNAAIADAKFAIDEINAVQLAAYFDKDTDLYDMIVKCPHNIQKYLKSVIDEDKIEVSQFRKYSDTLFSARVNLTQKITRTYGTIKTYKLDKTYFFTFNESGEYRVIMSTNEDAAQEEITLRLDFVQNEHVDSRMFKSDEKHVTVPPIETDGFVGWATQTKLDNGDVVMTVRILPDGTVLGDLEPMKLYPVYQTEK